MSESDLTLIPPLGGKSVDAKTLHAVIVKLALIGVHVGKEVHAITNLETCLAIGALVDIPVCELPHLQQSTKKLLDLWRCRQISNSEHLASGWTLTRTVDAGALVC